MAIIHKAVPVNGTGLNFKINGDAEKPATPSKNTIWVNTALDNNVALMKRKVYIDSTGSMQTHDTYIRYTYFFPCIAGHSYRFQAPQGYPFRVAYFTTTPATSNIQGTLHPNAPNSTSSTADVDVILEAPEGATWMGLYFYTASSSDTDVSSTLAVSITDETIGATTLTVTKKYIVGNEAPETRTDGTALVAGDVWVRTNDFIYIEVAAKEMTAKVMCAMIWDGTRWMPTESELYVNGTWEKLYNLIYDNGRIYYGLSWKSSHAPKNSAETSNYKISFEDSYIILGGQAGGGHSITGVCTTNPLNYDNIDEVKAIFVNAKRLVEGEEYSAYKYHNAMYIDSVGTVKKKYYDSVGVLAGAGAKKVKQVHPPSMLYMDTSGVTGEQYLTVQYETTGYYNAYCGLMILAYRDSLTPTIKPDIDAIYLYNEGVENIDWVSLPTDIDSSTYTDFGDEYITLSAKGTYGTSAGRQTIYTADTIDLTNYTTIKAIVSGYALNSEGQLGDGAAGYFHLGIAKEQYEKFTSGEDRELTYRNINPDTITDETREVIFDISDITGEYYIGIGIMAYRMEDKINVGYVHSVSLQ